MYIFLVFSPRAHPSGCIILRIIVALTRASCKQNVNAPNRCCSVARKQLGTLAFCYCRSAGAFLFSLGKYVAVVFNLLIVVVPFFVVFIFWVGDKWINRPKSALPLTHRGSRTLFSMLAFDVSIYLIPICTQ